MMRLKRFLSQNKTKNNRMIKQKQAVLKWFHPLALTRLILKWSKYCIFLYFYHRIYIFNLEGIGELEEGKVTCNFTDKSFDFRIVGLKKKNLRLFKKNLLKKINPSKSKYKCSSNRVTIYLSKEDKGKWSSLIEEEDKKPFGKKKDEKEDKDKDPQAALMDMMKEMY